MAFWWIIEVGGLLAAAWCLGWVARKLGLPALLGMLAGGVLVGHLLAPVLLEGRWSLALVSPSVRLAVLAVVLLRAGLGLSLGDLKRAGGRAVALGAIPMLADAAAVTLAGAWLLELPLATAAVLGFLVAAISPAIVIPGLLELIDRRRGKDRHLPNALLAGAPLDSILAVLGLGVCLDLALAAPGDWLTTLAHLPWTIAAGAGLGIGAGFGLAVWLGRGRPARRADTALVWLAACGLIPLCDLIGASYVIAILAVGSTLLARLAADRVAQLQRGLTGLWNVVQVALFALIGHALDLGPLAGVGLALVGVVLIGQLGRALGSLTATAGKALTARERLACILAYIPKATIQAAFAGLPLDRGLAQGDLLMSAAVLAIVLTAPLGSLALTRGTAALLPATAREN